MISSYLDGFGCDLDWSILTRPITHKTPQLVLLLDFFLQSGRIAIEQKRQLDSS